MTTYIARPHEDITPGNWQPFPPNAAAASSGEGAEAAGSDTLASRINEPAPDDSDFIYVYIEPGTSSDYTCEFELAFPGGAPTIASGETWTAKFDYRSAKSKDAPSAPTVECECVVKLEFSLLVGATCLGSKTTGNTPDAPTTGQVSITFDGASVGSSPTYKLRVTGSAKDCKRWLMLYWAQVVFSKNA